MPSDRILLITGASTGIGRATARAAVAEGYKVVVSARSEQLLEDLVAELGESSALAVRCDVTEWDQQQALVDSAIEKFGRIDAVFANAGFGGPGGFTQSTPEAWKEMVLTNVYGAALTVRATVDHLKQSKGHLLLTGSVAGRRAIPGSLYSCTKWAVTAMGEAVRGELAGSGVRVTLIEPGIVATPFWDDGKGPLEQPLEEADIAGAVLWALNQPPHVDVNEILMRPSSQAV
jgi:NADP-dependent 3-hydroxy acid dehydrogenase YdfG